MKGALYIDSSKVPSTGGKRKERARCSRRHVVSFFEESGLTGVSLGWQAGRADQAQPSLSSPSSPWKERGSCFLSSSSSTSRMGRYDARIGYAPLWASHYASPAIETPPVLWSRKTDRPTKNLSELFPELYIVYCF